MVALGINMNKLYSVVNRSKSCTYSNNEKEIFERSAEFFGNLDIRHYFCDCVSVGFWKRPLDKYDQMADVEIALLFGPMCICELGSSTQWVSRAGEHILC